MPSKTMPERENVKVLSALVLIAYLILKLLSLTVPFLLPYMRWPLRIVFAAFVILLILSETMPKYNRCDLQGQRLCPSYQPGARFLQGEPRRSSS